MLNLHDISRRICERIFSQLIAGCKPSCTLQHAKDFRDLTRERSASVSLRMSQLAMPQEERAWRRGYDANDKLRNQTVSCYGTRYSTSPQTWCQRQVGAPAVLTAAVPLQPPKSSWMGPPKSQNGPQKSKNGPPNPLIGPPQPQRWTDTKATGWATKNHRIGHQSHRLGHQNHRMGHQNNRLAHQKKAADVDIKNEHFSQKHLIRTTLSHAVSHKIMAPGAFH